MQAAIAYASASGIRVVYVNTRTSRFDRFDQLLPASAATEGCVVQSAIDTSFRRAARGNRP
jgi:hypothetical protein